ncbi:MAG: MFS transporter [Candidatus Lokiarchaeota archaeon]|nr:MFS transporter [Candidatus Lokiarchaeota archaeon]
MATSKPIRILAVFIIVFLGIFNYVDRAILVPNQEYILMDLLSIPQGDAAARTAMISGLHTVFKWSAAACTIVYGYLNDKFNRKLILVVGALAYSACTFITFAVTSYEQLVLLQIITAVSIGASLPTSYSILSDLYPQKNRGRIFGLFGISTILGDILGNMMVSVVFPVDLANLAVAPLSNWRMPFLVVGLLNLAFAGLAIAFLKDPKRAAAEEHLNVLVAKEGIEYAYKIRRADLADIVKNKSNFWLILNFVDNMTGGFMLATAIPWLVEHGASPFVAGIIILVPAIGILTGNLFFGWLGDLLFKRDKRGRVFTCLICVCVSFVLLPVAASLQFNLSGMDVGEVFTDGAFLGIIIVWLVYFFFNNGIGPHWHATIIDVNKVEARGTMLSVATFFEEFGEGLGILIGSLMHDAFVFTGAALPYSLTWGWLTVFLAGGAVFWFFLYRNVAQDISRVEELNKARAEELKARVIS